MLPMERCCKKSCLTKIPVKQLGTVRNQFQDKNLREQRAAVMEYLASQRDPNAPEGSKHKYKFRIGDAPVCMTAWRLALGLTQRRYHNIKAEVNSKYLILLKITD